MPLTPSTIAARSAPLASNLSRNADRKKRSSMRDHVTPQMPPRAPKMSAYVAAKPPSNKRGHIQLHSRHRPRTAPCTARPAAALPLDGREPRPPRGTPAGQCLTANARRKHVKTRAAHSEGFPFENRRPAPARAGRPRRAARATRSASAATAATPRPVPGPWTANPAASVSCKARWARNWVGRRCGRDKA